jgi:glycosyltransferase involved in cell wall biosynthesis
VEAETLYPSVLQPHDPPTIPLKKERIILNVGRFFRHGHCKKQLEMVQAFRRLLDEGALQHDWTLALAGQVQMGQEDYFEDVSTAARGNPIVLYPNATRKHLQGLFANSAIYWHATGLGEDLVANPDRAEHFGITTVEAMYAGCVPIVFYAGGQPEIVQAEINGCIFNDEEELLRKTMHVCKLFDLADSAFWKLSSAAHVRAAQFSKDRTQRKFLRMLELRFLQTSGHDMYSGEHI